MVRALVAGAVLALAAVSGVRGEDSHEFKAPATGQIFLPTTPNDFGSMIFSLLQQQVQFLGAKDGVETEGSPANLVATMAHYLMQSQMAFFKQAAPQTTEEVGDSVKQFDNIVANHNITFPFPNQTFPSYPNFTAPQFLKNLQDPPVINYNGLFTNLTKALGIQNRTDPISQDLINLLIQDPAGPELAGAFAALPNFPDPVSLGTANFSGGFYGQNTQNGTRSFANIGSTLFSYRPCFFQGNQAGVNIGPTLISATPRIAQIQPYGLEVAPKLIEVAPRILTVKPIGVNVQPLDIQVSPVLISISPKVNFYHPAVPGVSGSGK